MRISALFCGVVLICISSVAVADDQTQQMPKEHLLTLMQTQMHVQEMETKISSEWRVCRAPSDCGLVFYNCMHEAISANTAHLADAQGVVCRAELCSWLQCAPALYSFSPACNNGQCTTVPEPLAAY